MTIERKTDKYPVGKMAEMALELFKKGASVASVCLELNICYNRHRALIDESKKTYSATYAKAVKEGLWFSRGWWEREGQRGLNRKGFNAVLWMMNVSNRFRDDWVSNRTESKEIGHHVVEVISYAEAKKADKAKARRILKNKRKAPKLLEGGKK